MRYARKAIRYGITCYWLCEPRMVVFLFPGGKRVKKNMRVNIIWACRRKNTDYRLRTAYIGRIAAFSLMEWVWVDYWKNDIFFKNP